MKASELVDELQKQIADHGDLPVYHVDDLRHAEVTEIFVLDADRDQGWEGVEDLPRRFSVNVG